MFVWTIDNQSDSSLDVSIVFTFKNGQGETNGDDVAGGVWNRVFHQSGDEGSSDVSGVLMHQTIGNMQCTYAVAAKNSIVVQTIGNTQCTYAVSAKNLMSVTNMVAFNPNESGSDLWELLNSSGKLQSTEGKLCASYLSFYERVTLKIGPKYAQNYMER